MSKTNPLRIKNPEFSCNAPYEIGLEANVEISDPKSGYKFTRFSTFTFRTDNASGYPMQIALRINGEDEWYQQSEVSEITIRICGDYEADVIKQFFQHVGLMMAPMYGDTVKAVEDFIERK